MLSLRITFLKICVGEHWWPLGFNAWSKKKKKVSVVKEVRKMPSLSAHECIKVAEKSYINIKLLNFD